MEKKSILLFSGGIDSTVLAGSLKQSGHEFLALTMSTSFQSDETLTARLIAEKMGIDLEIFDASSIQFIAASSGAEFAVGGSLGGCCTLGGTYADFSIEVMHSIAEMYALCHNFDRILWAVHKDDVKDIDGLNKYLELRAEIVRLRTGKDVRIETPFIKMTKKDIVEMGYKLELQLEDTRSCSEKNGEPCGYCEQCLARSRVISEVIAL